MSRFLSHLLCGLMLSCAILMLVPSAHADVVYWYKFTDSPTGFLGSFSWTITQPGESPAPFIATTFEHVENPTFGTIYEVDLFQPDPTHIEFMTLIHPNDPRYSGPAYQSLTLLARMDFMSRDIQWTFSRNQVSITPAPEPVPEPASLSLLGIAWLPIVAARRRSRPSAHE